MVETPEGYKKEFAIRRVGGESSSFEVTIPREIVRKHAEEADVPLDEASEKLKAEIIYDDFDGIFVRFKEKSNRRGQK